jgi:hypothetical protein
MALSQVSFVNSMAHAEPTSAAARMAAFMSFAEECYTGGVEVRKL